MTVAIGPTLNHATVVTKNLEMNVGGTSIDDYCRRSSKPMLSAHVMSWLSVFPVRIQAHQQVLIVIPMAMLELASEKAQKSRIWHEV